MLLTTVQKRHRRTFSEDDRIQAQENVKKVEDDDAGEISEPEDQMMLQRDAKDWKVLLKPKFIHTFSAAELDFAARPPHCSPTNSPLTGSGSLRRPRPLSPSLSRHRITNQNGPSQKSSPSSSGQACRNRLLGRRLLLQMHPKSHRGPARPRQASAIRLGRRECRQGTSLEKGSTEEGLAQVLGSSVRERR